MTDIGATGPTSQTILTAMSCLIGVVALILLTARLARTRLAAAGQGRSLRLCESLPLDTKRRVHLVECDGTRILVLTGGSQDQVIARLTTQ